MSYDSKLLDATGLGLLRALQRDARVSFAELGRRLGLSAPAIAERVRNLEDAGILTGYRAEVDRAALGLPLTVFIRLQSPPSNYPKFLHLAQRLDEVLELHHVTGSEAFILKAAVSSVAHLESLIGKLSVFGQTATSLVLSSPLLQREIAPPKPR
jgi:Lrp/AsnC family leucine-responsive transcriptional regulator